jgi:hypothetical protein
MRLLVHEPCLHHIFPAHSIDDPQLSPSFLEREGKLPGLLTVAGEGEGVCVLPLFSTR